MDQLNFIEAIGLTAATLTTLSFLPQVIKTYKEKCTKDLSTWTLWCFFIGVVMWLIYGITIPSFSLICANTITSILAGIMVVFKIIYPTKQTEDNTNTTA